MHWHDNHRFSQNPRAAEFVQDPGLLYRELHKHVQPAWWSEYGHWCVADFATVDAVFRDRRFARLPPPQCPLTAWPAHMQDFSRVERWSLLALEPPQHTALRRRVNSAFIAREVRQLTPVIEQLCHCLIDDFADGPQRAAGQAQAHDANSGLVDLLQVYATPLPVQMITRLLGVPEHAGQNLLDWSHAMVRVYTGQQNEAEERQANAAAAEFDLFIRSLLTDRRERASDDLLSSLCAPDTNGESLSDEQIVSITVLLLNAGHEATVHQLGNAIYRLLREPQWIELLLSGEDAADAVVTETLRLDAPLHLFTRYAQTEVDLGHGIALAAGEQLALLLAAANTDPVRFEEPQRFNPQRRDGGHLSLGAGLHFCVGAALARAEIRTALQVLFKRLPELQLAKPVRYSDNYHFHGLEALPVHLCAQASVASGYRDPNIT